MYQGNKNRIAGKNPNALPATRRYSNPFFKSKKKGHGININFSPNTKLISLFSFLIFFSIFWIFFFSNYLDIKDINIEGRGKISIDEIKKYTNNQIKSNRFIFFSQTNIFLFDCSELTDFLHEKYSFENLEISKKYPDEIYIQFNEKPYQITWLEDEIYYYADKEGGVITEANLLELKERKYPLIQNLSDNKKEGSTISVDNKYFEFVISLFNEMKEYKDEFDIEKYIIDNDYKTVKMQIINGPKIYFNLDLDINKQINKLITVKREKLENNFNTIEYINLKIGDSVYYR